MIKTSSIKIGFASVILGFLIFLLMQYCQWFTSNADQKAAYIQQLQGDWLLQDNQFENGLCFSFLDTLCSTNAFDKLYFFDIRHDTLEISSPKFDTRFLPGELYRIVRLDEEQLILNPLTEKTRELYKHNVGADATVLKFKKISPEADSKAWQLAYEGPLTVAFNTVYLEVDSSGVLRMWNLAKEKYFEGSISNALMQNKLRQVPVTELRKIYKSDYACELGYQTTQILLTSKSDQYSSYGEGTSDQPIELQLLLRFLLNLEQFAVFEEIVLSTAINDHWLMNAKHRGIFLPSKFRPPPTAPPPIGYWGIDNDASH